METWKRILIVFTIIPIVLTNCDKSIDNHPVESEVCLNVSGDEKKTGWTWFEITAGVSTFQELTENFGQPESIVVNSHKLFDKERCLVKYVIEDNNVLFTIEEGRVIAIEFYNPGYPFGKSNISLNDLVENQGYPDLIGYNKPYGSGYRTIVWLNQGVQAVVVVGAIEAWPPSKLTEVELTEFHVLGTEYFYPMTEIEYRKSYLSSWYTEERPESDVIDLYPMNPFGWGD